jgi:CubicO group peptidase (beta-lactamase class C family)
MNRFAHPLVFLAVLLVQASSAAAQGDPHPRFANAIAQARATAWKAVTTGQGSGVTIAIMERGSIVYSEGFGVADRASNRAVDRDTRFNVGSVAKMFAAASILMLVEEGKVELDAPVARYIPDFTMADPRYRAITVRMLLNHSAGLPGVTVFVGFGRDTATHAELLDALKRSTLKHDPGAMSMYSNDGFTLAEIVVERTSGRKYMDFLAERIFVPLGMMHTGPNVGELGRRGIEVAEFYDMNSGKRYPREIVPLYAAGGISSTAEDLCRFGNALLPGGTPLLSRASLAELLRPQPTLLGSMFRNTAEFSQFGWDYALRVGGPVDNMLVFAKGGNTPFYTSDLQVLPEQGLVVALITSGRSSGDKLTQPILAGLLADRRIAVAGGAAYPPQAQAIPSELDRYVGEYVMEAAAVRISIDASRRTLMLAGLGSQAPPLELVYDNGYFYGRGGETRYYFVTGQGQDLLVASTMGLVVYDTVMFQKLAPADPPLALEVPMDGEAWLVRNAPPWMELFESAKPMATSRTYQELPGYVNLDGVRKIERPDFAGIAATALREQSDIALFHVDGKVWMRTANLLRSRARDVPALTSGSASMTIGPDGYNEWRAVAQGTILRFRMPGARARVIIAAADAVLHDSLVDGNEAYAPAGSYVFFAGAPGDTLRVTEIAP